MATAEEVAQVRRMAAEPTTDTYTDEAISLLVDGTGSVRAAVYSVWQDKAARYSTLVDTTESGSSRRNSQLHSNALNMMKMYEPISEEEVAQSSAPMTVAIERP